MVSVKAMAAIALTLIVAVPIGLGYGLASAEQTTTSWEPTSTTNATELLYNDTQDYYAAYFGTTNNSMLASNLAPDYVTVGDTVTSYPAVAYSHVQMTFNNTDYTSMENYIEWSFSLLYGEECYVRSETRVDNGDGTENVTVNVTYIGGPHVVRGDSNDKVMSHGGDLTKSVAVTTYTGQYADVTAGWKLPTTADSWKNNQYNSEVVFSIYLPDDSSFKFGTMLTITNTDGNVTAHRSQQGQSYNYTLGHYNYLRAIYSTTGITVYGLSEWPEYGSAPETYNSFTWDFGSEQAAFTSIYLYNANRDVIFRVDSAQVVAGSFPATSNFYLYFKDKYPQQSLDFTIKSVGKYGGSINIAGTHFNVEDGKISGTDTNGDSFTIPLRGATIRYLYNGITYDISINGHPINGNVAWVYFGGLWSLTSSISLLAQTTSTQQVWAPGEFAFDKEDFAACGLLVAGICMVGLGMTGNRSGTKIGVLLMVCGGAGLAYLTII